MIGAVFLALQLAASTSALVLRDGHRTMRVPTVPSEHGAFVRLEALAPMMPVEVYHDSASWYTVEVWGARLQLQAGSAMVRVGDQTRPLAAAPVVRGGHLLVPVQVVSEVFPSVVPNTRWDEDSSQLVLFTSTSGDETAPVGRAGRLATDRPAVPARRVADESIDRRLPPIPAKHAGRTVIVDAGHGGVDNGMTGPIGGGPKIYEKNITLDVALKLGALLQARGLNVVYTRTTDTLIALDDRGRIANRAAGDLFISIHVNAANPTWKDPAAARGFETYFLSEARTEDARRVEQMENAAVRFEDAPANVKQDDPLSFILSDMRQNEHLRESSELADMIQRRLGKVHPGPSRGVKQAGFRVLVTAYMPAVLVEIGFGTNPREAEFLSEPAKQQAIAAAIADAATDYLDRYERRIGTARAGGASR